jgi:outer membrane protein assembly factor BamD
MNGLHNMARWLFAVIFVVFSLGGCAMFERFLGGDDIEKSPAELMTEGMESMERGSYTAATEAFQNLKDRYPYSKFAVTAELKMADALYERELYNEAFDAYDEFERLHPKHMTIPYVIYRKGMCHFSQVSTIDRSQSNTHEAKSQFERLVRKFPGTEYANKARRKIRECYISLAEYELCVGHFYYKMKKYHAAMRRYQYLLTNYPDLGQYHEALEYLGKCKQKIAEEQKEL